MNPPENDDYTKFGIEISRSLHRQVKSAAANRGKSMKKAADEAFTAWLAAGEQTGKVDHPEPTPGNPEMVYNRKQIKAHFAKKNARWHELLEMILNSNVKVATDAVTKNLEAFALTVQTILGVLDESPEGFTAGQLPENIASRITELRGRAEQSEGRKTVLPTKKHGAA